MADDDAPELIADRQRLVERLAEHTRRFELALANSAITVFEQDRDLRYTWVYNPALDDTPANIIGKTDPDMLDPAAAAQLEALKRQVLATGEPLRAEVTAQPPGVPVHHFDLQIEARRDAGGAITGIICAAFDITGRKATEAALQASEARYRLLFEQSVDGICVIDDDGAIVDVNPSCCELFGYGREAFLQLGVRTLLDPGEAQRLAGAWDRLEAGEAISGEWLFRRSDGSSFIGEVTGRRQAGQLFQGIVRDVTERKRSETWLQGAHQTLSALVDRSPFGIYIVDADLRILQASEGARQAFAGVNPLIGRHLAEAQRQIWDQAFADDVIARFRHTLATGEPYAAETVEQRADRDETEAYDWRIERITLPDGRPGVVCHFYDLTERHRHDAHVALLMRELDHRARNMLTLVEAIARRTIAHDPREFTERFSQRIQALAANQELLVRNSWLAVPLAAMVQSHLAFLGDMRDSRISVAGPAVDVTAAASQTLGMALHELATNAVKYGALSNPAGRVSIRWHLTDSDADPRFHLEWQESDGPPVVEPTRLGFGSTVIRRMIDMSFGGKAELDFAPTGFRWRIDCRAEAVLEGDSLRRLVVASLH